MQLPDIGSGVRSFGARSRRDLVGAVAGPLDSLADSDFKFVEVLKAPKVHEDKLKDTVSGMLYSYILLISALIADLY